MNYDKYREEPDCEEELWNKMKFLYPNLTIEEFNEEIEREGYWNMETRININLKNRYELMEKYGGDGLDGYRQLFHELRSGELDKKVEIKNRKKKKYKKRLKEMFNNKINNRLRR